MKLISWNVNGIRSAAGKGLFEFLAAEKPEVLCLQETKIHQHQLTPELASPPGYRSVFVDAHKPGYSGVATFFSDKLSKCENCFGIEQVAYDREGRFIISDLGEFLLYNIYFPSGTSGEERQAYKYSFLDAFYDHLKRLPTRDKKRLIICGDFNICHREIDIHHPAEATRRQLTGFLPEERAWIDRFIALGFIDAFRMINGDEPKRYTWWSYRAGSRGKNLGWRIDYFFVSEELKNRVKQAKIMENVTGSDHCPISLVLE